MYGTGTVQYTEQSNSKEAVVVPMSAIADIVEGDDKGGGGEYDDDDSRPSQIAVTASVDCDDDIDDIDEFLGAIRLRSDDDDDDEAADEDDDDENGFDDANAAGPLQPSRPRQQQQPIAVVGDFSDDSTTTTAEFQQQQQRYASRKPVWWKRQSGKAGLSKGQRRAVASMEQRYGLKRPPVYGALLPSWDDIFSFPQQQKQKQPCDDSAAVSAAAAVEVWLELGFGLGDNLLCLAAASADTAAASALCVPHPESLAQQQQQPNHNSQYHHHRRRCLVGAEVHAAGIGTVFARMQSAIGEAKYWDGYTLFDESIHGSNIASTRHATPFDSNNTAAEPNPQQQQEAPVNITDAISSSNSRAPTTTTIRKAAAAAMYDHVRIYAGDGTKLLQCVPDHSVTAVLVTFPDPFMGNQQQHWRLLQVSVLTELRRILLLPPSISPLPSIGGGGGGRLYLATDHAGYHQWSHDQVAALNRILQEQVETNHGSASSSSSSNPMVLLFALVEPTPDRASWLPVVSKYEQKGWDEGRPTWLSCWELVVMVRDGVVV